MNVSPLQTKPDAANVPLERLEDTRGLTEQQKVAEVSRQFEALLLRQILEEAQKTVIHSDFNNTSAVSDIYRGMISEQIAESISKSGAFGLAGTVRHQLTQQLHPASSAGHDETPDAAEPTPPVQDAVRPSARSGVNRPPAHGATLLVGPAHLP